MSRAILIDDAKAGEPRIAARSTAMPRAVPAGLLVIATFLLALAPRLVGLSLFPTSDEDSWMRRAGGFTFGLVNAQLGRTYQNGHPGVTTMWVAMLSQGPAGALRFADRVHGLRYVAQVPGYLEGLAQARIGFAVLGALGAALAVALVWRLFDPLTATIAGLGLACEPFLVANAQLVHVDGPLTAFMAVSALAALVRWGAGGGRGFVVLSGVLGGLALLSKTPAVFLVVFVPALAVLRLVFGRARVGLGRHDPAASESGRPADVAIDLAIWSALVVLTFALLWPALWALGPLEVFNRVAAFTRETGGQPDEVGSFFLGQVLGDPGPLYYPLATLFRLSPFVTIGLVALVLFARRIPRECIPRLVGMVLFVGGFAAMMTFGPKKFDRYLLPIFPLLVVLAAVGWRQQVGPLLAHPRLGIATRVAIGASLPVLAAWPLVSVYPYALAYYNPLVGGGVVAQRVVMVGNGEGLDQAASWIAAQPNADNLWVASHSFDILAAMMPSQGEPLRDGVPNDADYIVTYGRRIQMRRWGPSLDRYLQSNPPVHTVRINGIDYVQIHPGPKRTGLP